QWSFQFVVEPIISIPGLAGNILSLIVICQQGLHKSSNILLVSLSISDISHLLCINNIPYFLYYSQGSYFVYSPDVNIALYHLTKLSEFFITVGKLMSLTLIVLITTERLIAIFLPLKFSTIVTPWRTLVSVCCLLVLLATITAYFMFYTQLIQGPLRARIYVSKLYYADKRANVYDTLQEFTNNITGIVPLCYVSVGCALIGVKVKMASRKRLAMTSSSVYVKTPDDNTTDLLKSRAGRSMTKTTRTLLSVCVLYIICGGVSYLLRYVNIAFGEYESMRLVLQEVNKTAMLINSAANFVIYVVTNRNFRNGFLQIFSCCRQTKTILP
ncbi:unnamed protein product, partial [Lymnaea stagnalis]